MPVVIDGTNGITTPDLESAGIVTSNGLTTSLYPLVSGTAVASTSGTSIDFTGIPSWVKRITVMFSGVSTSGTSGIFIQLGAGSVETTGYVGIVAGMQSNTSYIAQSSSGGFVPMSISFTAATSTISGSLVLSNLSANIWAGNGVFSREAASNTGAFIGGSKTLSATLDRVRITTVNGTDTFDAGSINIMYE